MFIRHLIIKFVNKAMSIVKFVLATKFLAMTTLRNVLSSRTQSEALQNKELIAAEISKIVDKETDPWGIKGYVEYNLVGL